MGKAVIGRRRFVKALGAGALLGSGALSRAQPMAESAPVLVLGAGLSGLAAARWLRNAGLSSLVLEARNRVGGRAYTNFALPDRAEYGAVEVGSSYARVRALASSFGLEIEPPARRWLRTFTLHVNGQTLHPRDWPQADANKLPLSERTTAPNRLEAHYLAQANPLPTPVGWDGPQWREHDRSITEVLRSQGASAEALRLANVAGNHNHSDEVSALGAWRSALALRQETGTGHFKLGSQALAEAMAEGLAPRLQPGQAVVEISQMADGVRVRTAGGAQYRGQACICTLPLPALRGVRLDLPLAPAQRRALAQVRYTRVTVALFDCEPFWEDDGLPPAMWTDTPMERFFPRIHRDTGSCVGLKAFINGRGAEKVDGLDEAGFEALALDTLARIRPATKGRVHYLGRHRWGTDPYAGGAWAAWSPGQVAAERQAVRGRTGSVRFAGEHTAVDAPGMEGAVRSGERAAREVIELLS